MEVGDLERHRERLALLGDSVGEYTKAVRIDEGNEEQVQERRPITVPKT